MTCTLDKIVRQTRTPVAVTVAVGSLESMYVYAFIQYLNGHSYRFSWLDTWHLSRRERQGPHRQTSAIECQHCCCCCCCGDCEAWCWIASFLCRGAALVPPNDEAKPVSCPFLSQNFLRMTKIGSGRTRQGRMIEYVCVVLINFRGYWFFWIFFFLTDIPCDMPCAEAVGSTNNLLSARLRNGLASGSRSGTPEIHSSRSTPPKHGVRPSHSPTPQSKPGCTKHKVEDEEPLWTLKQVGCNRWKTICLVNGVQLQPS